MEKKPSLWTRDFTILTIGSVVSLLGNAVAGFSLGLLMLEYSNDSASTYALFTLVFTFPQIIMPIIAGPYLDRFSRKRVIYSLDFASALIYLLIFFLLRNGQVNVYVMLPLCFLIGSINSVYQTAYDSLYPLLITEGNYSKAYSISSMLHPLSQIMVYGAVVVYERVNSFEPLFFFISIAFAIAAIFEIFIRVDEAQMLQASEKKEYGIKKYTKDFKLGLQYIAGEKGLMVITAYFVAIALTGAVGYTVILPYFKATPGLGVTNYVFVMGCNILGRVIGGFVHYKFKLPPQRKYTIALCVYLITATINAIYLFVPMWFMMVLMLIDGLVCVTSYNIRISSTQNHVPNELRGRFNGTFQMLCSLGGIIGQGIVAVIGDMVDLRMLVLYAGAVNILLVFLIMYRGRKHVRDIYNVDI